MKPFIKSLVNNFYKDIIHPEEPDDVRVGKRLFVWINLLVIPLSIFGGILGVLGGSLRMIMIASSSMVVFPLNLFLLTRTRKFSLHFSIWVIGMMLLILFWGILLGGFSTNFSGYWVVFLPLMLVVLVSENRSIIGWFVVFSLFTISFSLLDPYVSNPENAPANSVFNNSYTVITSAALVLLTIAYYKRQKNIALNLLAIERDRSESLLLNILPKKIADILKIEEGTIAEHYDSASILFADMVGFTPMSVHMTPSEMIELLNKIYSHFDTLAEKYAVEKIRTIGDNYMVASGVPEPTSDHAKALANMALDMLSYAKNLPTQYDKSINFRIGINSGPLVAGVIGQKKFQYDVWGDTVNTASRMESHGVAGQIQITAHTRELIQDEFVCEKRGILSIKGKGEMETWLLVGRK